jgi:hypothetical protein
MWPSPESKARLFILLIVFLFNVDKECAEQGNDDEQEKGSIHAVNLLLPIAYQDIFNGA